MPATRPTPPHVVTLSLATFLKAIGVALGLALLWFLRDILAVVFVALLLAALIDPFADWLHARGLPRALGVIVIYVVMGTFAVLGLVVLVPIVVEQFFQLLNNLSISYAQIADSFTQLKTLSVTYGFDENLRSSLASLQQAVAGSFTSIFSTVRGFIGGIATLFIVLVLAFYMVAEEDAARKYFRTIAPVEYQPYLSQLFTRMQKRIGAWLRGQIILGLLVGSAVFIGLVLLDVKYALLLAIIAGCLEVVPYVGPLLSVIPAAIIGFAQDPITGLLVLAVYFIVQQLENNLFVPKVMQKVTGLSPVVSIIALMVGIKFGGLAGAVLSIPVATMLAVVLEDLFAPDTV